MVNVHAVTAREDLINQDARVFSLRHQHPPIACGSRGSHLGGSTGERDFGVIGKCAEAHASHHDREVKLDGLLGKTRPQDSPGGALLPVSFQRNAREGTGNEGQVIKGGQGATTQGAETTDAVSPQLCLGLDVLNGLRAPDVALSQHRVLSHNASLQVSNSFLSNLHNRPPATIFLKGYALVIPYRARVDARKL